MSLRENAYKNRRNAPRINDQIHADRIRLITEDGTQVGIVSLERGLEEARKAGLDLLQIADGDPVVCKLVDSGKKLYEDKKRRMQSKKKQQRIQVKEMKFRPGTEEGDYQIKLRKLKDFLERGDKVRVYLRFRGREIIHKEFGIQLLERIKADLAEYGSSEDNIKLLDRQLCIHFSPVKRKGSTKPQQQSASSEDEMKQNDGL